MSVVVFVVIVVVVVVVVVAPSIHGRKVTRTRPVASPLQYHAHIKGAKWTRHGVPNGAKMIKKSIKNQ